MILPASPPGTELGARLIAELRRAEIKIPPYPAVASSLTRLSRDPHSKLGDVAAVVATDAALTATVLRHVATAAMKSATPVTLEAAIWKLGLEQLIRVVVATTIGTAASASGPLAVLRRDQWRHSLLASMFCTELAPRRGVAPDQAFLAGLLHDIGAIVLVSCVEALGTPSLPVLPEATWRRLIEQHHVEFGMVVVKRWELPEPIAEVIEHHHAPQNCMRVYRPLVQLVAIADHIIEILDRGPSGGIAALGEVPGLELDERRRIAGLMPRVAEQMAQFEVPTAHQVTELIAASTDPVEEAWPVQLVVEGRARAQYRATTLAPSALAFRSPVALQPAWLTELTLHCPPDKIPMLAHVKSCQALPDGGYLVTAQPFGLAGDDERAWLRLIERTRQPEPARL